MKTNEFLEKIRSVFFQGHLNNCTTNLSTSTISKQRNIVSVDVKLFAMIEKVLENKHTETKDATLKQS